MPVRPLSFKVTDTGCFQITSHKPTLPEGYVRLVIRRVRTYAHRLVWEECFGLIPRGMCVCHKCDSPNCINPEHLFLGTHADNMRDMAAKDRSTFGERSANAKLTFAQVREARLQYVSGDAINGRDSLAREFGVGHTTMRHVLNGCTWRRA